MFSRLPFLLFIFSLIFAPLAFGAVHTYAYTLVFLSVQAGVLLVAIDRIRKRPREKNSFIIQCPLHLIFALFFLYLVFQMVPLPFWLGEWISPFSAVSAQKAIPASLAVTGPKVSNWVSLAPYLYPVRLSLIRLTCYYLLFVGLLHVIDSQKRLNILILVLIGSGLFQALYGLVQAYGGGHHIWWFKRGADYITGTFINRNNFAGYLMMVAFLTIGYAAANRPKKKVIGRWTGRISISFEAHSRRFLIIFLSSVMFVGLIFSRSRGGITSFFIALCLLGILFLFKKGQKATAGVLLTLIGITTGYAFQIGLDPVINRFKALDITENARIRYTEKTIEMAGDYFITGVGVGNFPYAYPKYQAAEDKKVFIRYAHNDWAQFLAEGGIVGLALLLGALTFFLYGFFRTWGDRSDPLAVYLGIGSMAALFSIMFHSFVAFDLHIPANPLTLAAILAVGYAAIHLERRRSRERFFYHYIGKDEPPKFYPVIFLLVGIICWSGWWTIKHFMAEAYCNTVHNSTLNRDQNPPLEEIKKAIGWDRSNAEYWYKLGRELGRRRDEGDRMQDAGSRMQDRQEHQMEIIRAFEEAVRLNPFKAQYHLRLGWEYTYLWRESDYHQKWLPAADISMERAAYFAGKKNPHLHVELGNYWVMRSKSMDPANPGWESAWARACWHYHQALELESGYEWKRMVKEIKKYVWLYYPAEYFVRQAVE